MERSARDVTRLLEERTGKVVPRLKYQPKTPGLLKLPLELRVQIFRYLLPYTGLIWTIYGRRAFVWYRGQTAILAVNHQIHAEAANVMYGDALFVVEVGFDGIIFRPRVVLRTGSTSPSTPPFLDTIRPSNVKRLRHLAINVQHVDSYTGMIKYNYGGDGLTDGLRKQVQKLVDALSTATELRNIRVHMDGGNSDLKAAQRVLEPFAQLTNIHGRATVDGDAAMGFHVQLETAMMSRDEAAQPA